MRVLESQGCVRIEKCVQANEEGAEKQAAHAHVHACGSVKSAEVRRTQPFPLNLVRWDRSADVLTTVDGSASVIDDDEDDEDDDDLWLLRFIPDAATVSRIHTESTGPVKASSSLQNPVLAAAVRRCTSEAPPGPPPPLLCFLPGLRHIDRSSAPREHE